MTKKVYTLPELEAMVTENPRKFRRLVREHGLSTKTHNTEEILNTILADGLRYDNTQISREPVKAKETKLCWMEKDPKDPTRYIIKEKTFPSEEAADRFYAILQTRPNFIEPLS